MLEKVSLDTLDVNFTKLLEERWGLVTAGADPVNPMTVSWGQVGRLWNKPVCTVYIRPQRFTYGLMNDAKYFSLSFLPAERHEAAVLCGSKSGRNTDKVKECGLTVVDDGRAPYYAEAELVLVCRKLYEQDLTGENFLEKDVDEKNYPAKDYHRMYVGEIETVLRKA